MNQAESESKASRKRSTGLVSTVILNGKLVYCNTGEIFESKETNLSITTNLFSFIRFLEQDKQISSLSLTSNKSVILTGVKVIDELAAILFVLICDVANHVTYKL